MAGFILRSLSAGHIFNKDLYIAQYILIAAGPPIYAATAYNILGRLYYYLPMHAPLHPGRTYTTFVWLGMLVETLTAAGASRASAGHAMQLDDVWRTGGYLFSASLLLQGVIECGFISMVALIHRRAARSGMLPRNVRMICIMLYGTSTLVIVRCIARAIESFGMYSITMDSCGPLCEFVYLHEWYLYAFEAAPMVLYTFWINALHPGRVLPSDFKRYLDVDGVTERMGPGWLDKRSRWVTFLSPFQTSHAVKFWTKPEEWPEATDGSFAISTATNTGRGLGWS
jgi:hypothetical protein